MQNPRLKTFKVIGLFMLLVTITNSLSAQTTAVAKPETVFKAAPASIISPTIYIDKFFKSYDKLSTTRAVIDIFKTNPLIDSNGLIKLIAKIDTTRSLVGAYLGKELIVQRKASNSLVLYSYLVKHQNQPIRFTFMFYKPKNDWVIYRLYFDDQVDSELEQSAKITGKP